MPLSRREMAVRAFRFIDDNGNGTIHVSAMDMIVRMLQGQLQFTKASFDFLENLRSEIASSSSRDALESDFIAFFLTIPTNKVSIKLPNDAHWTVFHPNSPSVHMWELLILTAAVYFFWCARRLLHNDQEDTCVECY
jgi:hypothetical protein